VTSKALRTAAVMVLDSVLQPVLFGCWLLCCKWWLTIRPAQGADADWVYAGALERGYLECLCKAQSREQG
jgi:hypothetical protein